MNNVALRRLAGKALIAHAAMIVAVQGVQAEPSVPSREPAALQMGARLSLHEACPTADNDLADVLLPAWELVDKPSSVEVTFKVRGRAVYDVAPESGSRYTYHQLRRAIAALSCNGGDDQPHVIRLTALFVQDARRR